jgi:hypothetical protein
LPTWNVTNQISLTNLIKNMRTSNFKKQKKKMKTLKQ